MSGGSSGQNYIVNGSFEDDYFWLSDDLQQPNGWQLTTFPADAPGFSYAMIDSESVTGASPTDGARIFTIRITRRAIEGYGIKLVQDIDFRGNGRISFNHITVGDSVGASIQKVSIIYQGEDLTDWGNEIVLHEGNGASGTNLWNTSSAVISIPSYVPMIKLVVDVYSVQNILGACYFHVDNFVLT